MTVVRRVLAGLVGTVASLVSLVAVSSATGGPITWAVTHGGSMVPAVTPGTLTVLQQRPVYRVGDVVGYRNADLSDQVVLHRVIEVADDHLVLKGDANSWVDPYQPTRDRVLGEQVLAVPRVGDLLAGVDGPLPVALLAGAVTLLALSRRTGGRRRSGPTAGRRRRVRVARLRTPGPPAPTSVSTTAPVPRPEPDLAARCRPGRRSSGTPRRGPAPAARGAPWSCRRRCGTARASA